MEQNQPQIPQSTHTDKTIIFLIVISILIIAVVASLVLPNYKKPQEQVFCTQDAKLCPNGSYVSRTGPNCEFSPCPDTPISDTYKWKQVTDSEQGISYQYPESLNTKYIHTNTWPPVVTVKRQKYTCLESSPVGAGSSTIQGRVGDTIFCMTERTGAAAGTQLTDFQYTFPQAEKGTNVIEVSFGLFYPTCENFEEPAQSNCKKENANLDENMIAFKIAKSITDASNTETRSEATPIDPLDSNTSGITGMVTMGPTCPVLRDPPDPDCDDRPTSQSFVVTNLDDKKAHSQFISDESGRFKIVLPPGRYTIEHNNARPYPHCETKTVTVRSNIHTRINISCDTGIR